MISGSAFFHTSMLETFIFEVVSLFENKKYSPTLLEKVGIQHKTVVVTTALFKNKLYS